jgi:hypothetical protein
MVEEHKVPPLVWCYYSNINHSTPLAAFGFNLLSEVIDFETVSILSALSKYPSPHTNKESWS